MIILTVACQAVLDINIPRPNYKKIGHTLDVLSVMLNQPMVIFAM
jgi:hypothetical protein